jgi:mono/diheme cytochrome c family protein
MPSFQGALTDQEVAAVVSYVRNAWSNNASTVSVEEVNAGEETDRPAQ